MTPFMHRSAVHCEYTLIMKGFLMLTNWTNLQPNSEAGCGSAPDSNSPPRRILLSCPT
jgi:hypothetical protein